MTSSMSAWGRWEHGDWRGRERGYSIPCMQFLSIMDYVQALFSFFIAPLFGTVILECFGNVRRRPWILGIAGGYGVVNGMWAW